MHLATGLSTALPTPRVNSPHINYLGKFSAIICASSTARIFVTWRDTDSRPSEYCAAITELWAGSEVVKEADMYSYFDAQLTTAPTSFRSM